LVIGLLLPAMIFFIAAILAVALVFSMLILRMVLVVLEWISHRSQILERNGLFSTLSECFDPDFHFLLWISELVVLYVFNVCWILAGLRALQ
jgi:hypothetical protein